MSTIRICKDHKERQTPLIQTLAFPGAEWWCPQCGNTGGYLGTGLDVQSTSELIGRQAEDKAATKDFLRATGILCCSQTLFGGEWVKPDQLPAEEQQRLAAIRENWAPPAMRSYVERGISVWQLTDYEWFAAKTLPEAIAHALEQWGSPKEQAIEECGLDEDTTECDLDATIITLGEHGDPDAEKVSYREQIRRMLEKGEAFPCMFACTES